MKNRLKLSSYQKCFRLGLVLRTGARFLKKTKLHETDCKYLTTAEKRVLGFLCGVNDGRAKSACQNNARRNAE